MRFFVYACMYRPNLCVCERECVCPEKLKLLFPGCIVNVSVCFTACLRGKHERMHNGRRPIAMVTGCKRMKVCEKKRGTE